MRKPSKDCVIASNEDNNAKRDDYEGNTEEESHFEFAKGASGLIAAIREKALMDGFNATTSQSDFIKKKIPESSDRVEDLVLGTLLNGAWQPRRIIITKDVISFALVGEDSEIDVIPLAEVENVDDLSTVEATNPADGRSSSELPADLVYVNALHIATNPEGYNSGRVYYLQATSSEQQTRLIGHLLDLSKSALKRREAKSAFAKSQDRVRRVHSSRAFQTVAASLIVLNFFFNIIEAQFVDKLSNPDGSPSLLGRFLDRANLLFTIIFTLELLVNLYAHWLRPFISNPWSMLDGFVVFMSLVALGPVDIPITVLRLMRAFRVIRLFGRLKALKKMVAALSSSIVPMMNAFLILFIIASIYSILGVSMFGHQDDLQFGQFEQAFVTMFRVTTDGSWPDGVPSHDENGTVNWRIASFMMSYIVLVNWVVLQVSVAVLLDSFVSASTAIDEEEKRRQREETGRRQEARSPLEPLLKKLTQVYVDEGDLSDKLRRLYQLLDTDASGSLGCEEFCANIKKLDFHPRIHMAASDFLSITRGGALCDASGQLGLESFQLAMREQIRLYAQGQLCNPEQRSRMDAELSQISGLKWLMMEQQSLRRDLLLALADAPCTPPAAAAAPPVSAAGSGILRPRRPERKISIRVPPASAASLPRSSGSVECKAAAPSVGGKFGGAPVASFPPPPSPPGGGGGGGGGGGRSSGSLRRSPSPAGDGRRSWATADPDTALLQTHRCAALDPGAAAAAEERKQSACAARPTAAAAAAAREDRAAALLPRTADWRAAARLRRSQSGTPSVAVAVAAAAVRGGSGSPAGRRGPRALRHRGVLSRSENFSSLDIEPAAVAGGAAAPRGLPPAELGLRRRAGSGGSETRAGVQAFSGPPARADLVVVRAWPGGGEGGEAAATWSAWQLANGA